MLVLDKRFDALSFTIVIWQEEEKMLTYDRKDMKNVVRHQHMTTGSIEAWSSRNLWGILSPNGSRSSLNFGEVWARKHATLVHILDLLSSVSLQSVTC